MMWPCEACDGESDDSCESCGGTGVIQTCVECVKLRRRNQVFEETIGAMISYLAHQDQDADHAWMAKTMRSVL